MIFGYDELGDFEYSMACYFQELLRKKLAAGQFATGQEVVTGDTLRFGRFCLLVKKPFENRKHQWMLYGNMGVETIDTMIRRNVDLDENPVLSGAELEECLQITEVTNKLADPELVCCAAQHLDDLTLSVLTRYFRRSNLGFYKPPKKNRRLLYRGRVLLIDYAEFLHKSVPELCNMIETESRSLLSKIYHWVKTHW